ncbi:MAG TPA: adenylyl-sulfate reductase subunit alpha [Chlorobaculum sp.]|uniref:Adenylylsulfate reductase, alpha subunit n=1 Tax=Chlorobaculum tepidum (strain ATCC 49652 / DSM 12025 / NBRC 103806 / TLS) TaxID=194439 RepID=Q8KE27_CHLTE|nr:adenylyl-sulfate reductase subunit alpha [Chlorobaculum tepidum]AAM72101.1 adenylylsulfate reductase, alpha subunit [Chlorobaculum tepidum TLS]HBU24112.1 adenylyl-sulfate reductase subunit alpha [Chlorobaculum sp.]
MGVEKNEFKFSQKPEVVYVDTDILLIGGGMACCGAAYEAAKWATPKGLRITMVDKAAVDRSGAVAMGLSAINTYCGENDPADYVKYVRADLMGIIREDLVYDLGRHVDNSVHLFEEWGLPIWKRDEDGSTMDGAKPAPKLTEGGKPVRSGRWQIMINGESYKVIVAEAAKKALEYNRKETGVEQNLYERVFISELIHDKNNPSKVAGAIGFSVREHKAYVFTAKTMLLACGGAVNVYRPRSTAEGQGRAWYPVWNAGTTYALAAQAGCELVLMENRFVPARFKDGYGPVGAWFLFFKCKATNSLGEDYCATNLAAANKDFGKYAEDPHKLTTAMRNHMMMIDMKAGKGPILMRTHEAMAALAETMTPKQIKHLEAEAWEDFLDMCIGQAVVWAGNNIEPEKTPSELMPTEPYLLGSHAGCAGIWVSGPGDIAGVPAEWSWGYNRMTTVDGLFTAGDGVGASGHKFSSGSHAEGRIAGKSMTAYCLDHADYKPELGRDVDEVIAEIYAPMETFAKYKDYSTDPSVNPNYIRPKMFQARLQKIMDEYVAGVSTWYTTSKTMLEKGLEHLSLLKEDAEKMAAADLHELMRAWENYHRLMAGEAHARHILFREDSRYPGYYFRADHFYVDDENWKCFTISKYDRDSKEWTLSKRDYVQVVPD